MTMVGTAAVGASVLAGVTGIIGLVGAAFVGLGVITCPVVGATVIGKG